MTSNAGTKYRFFDNLRNGVVPASTRELGWCTCFPTPARIAAQIKWRTKLDERFNHLETSMKSCLVQRRVSKCLAVRAVNISTLLHEGTSSKRVVRVSRNRIEFGIQLPLTGFSLCYRQIAVNTPLPFAPRCTALLLARRETVLINDVTICLHNTTDRASQSISVNDKSLHCPRRSAVNTVGATRIFVAEKNNFVIRHPSLETIDHLCRITASQE
jgi:hypothetical protein